MFIGVVGIGKTCIVVTMPGSGQILAASIKYNVRSSKLTIGRVKIQVHVS
jgi:hypothetical protein